MAVFISARISCPEKSISCLNQLAISARVCRTREDISGTGRIKVLRARYEGRFAICHVTIYVSHTFK